MTDDTEVGAQPTSRPRTVQLQSLDPGTGKATVLHPISLQDESAEYRIALRAVPGADAVHIALVGEQGETLVRADVPTLGNSDVQVVIGRDERGAPSVVRRSMLPILFLPCQTRFAPPDPIQLPSRSEIDVAIVVDGTTGLYNDIKDAKDNPGYEFRPLLAQTADWHEHIDELMELLDALFESAPSLRVSVMAFGDVATPNVTAADLKPKYVLAPASPFDRGLKPYSAHGSHRRLETLLPSPGGDFVDALADAMHFVGDLEWRDGARRLLLVTGDSPGHSYLHPLPRGADANPRTFDIDEIAMRLHDAKIEVATIYHDLPPGNILESLDIGVLLSETRRQYQRLASRPELTANRLSLDVNQLAKAILADIPLLARGSCWGILDKVDRVP